MSRKGSWAKPKSYKRSALPDDGEQQMPVRVFEINVDVENQGEGDKIGFFKEVEKESEIQDNETALYLPSSEKPNSYKIMNERITILEQDRKKDKQENTALKETVVYMAKNLFLSKINELIIMIAQLERSAEIAHINKELSSYQPKLGRIKRLYEARMKIKDQKLKETFDSNTTTQKLLRISNNKEFQDFFQIRNEISHPKCQKIEVLVDLVDELKKGPFEMFDDPSFNLAQKWLEELKNVPDINDLLNYYNNMNKM